MMQIIFELLMSITELLRYEQEHVKPKKKGSKLCQSDIIFHKVSKKDGDKPDNFKLKVPAYVFLGLKQTKGHPRNKHKAVSQEQL